MDTQLQPQSHPDMELKVHIRALLNGFRRSRKNPALSLEELAVAVITVQPHLTLVELQRHILTAFKYYNEASVESSITRGYRGSVVISHFNTTFATLLRRFDLPFEVHCADSDDEDDDEDELEVSPAAARIFLQKHLVPPNDGQEKRPFPFLKLPVELRLQIYGLCLGLPKSGVSVRQAHRHSGRKEIVVRTRDFDAELQISEWEDVPAPTGVRARWDNFEFRNRHDGTLKCQDLHMHLALLSVNSEIYNEAMPVFYSVNSFICSDLSHLESFLATLASERREQLSHISFFYTKTTHSKAAKAFKMLGEIEKLKRLDIVIDEAEFVGLTKSKGERMFPDVLKLPGFHTLKSMRAVKTVQFHGECDTIRDALQSWVVDNEINADKPKKKKKNKAYKNTRPKTAKTAKKIAPDVETNEQEDDSLGTTNAEQSEVEEDEGDTQHLALDTTPKSTRLSSYYFNASSPKPSTPLIRMAAGLGSPFKVNPSNSASYLATRFQMQNSSSGRHNASLSSLDRKVMATGTTLYERNEEKQQGFSQQGYLPVPNIATRMLLHGPGQMGDWKPVGPRQDGGEAWGQTTAPSQFPSEETAEASVEMMHAATSAMLKMEDLLAEHDDYELP